MPGRRRIIDGDPGRFRKTRSRGREESVAPGEVGMASRCTGRYGSPKPRVAWADLDVLIASAIMPKAQNRAISCFQKERIQPM